MKDEIMEEAEKWVEYRTYTILNNCVFDSGKTEYIKTSVIAKGIYEAADIAKDFLLSRKAFLVKEVVGQRFEASSSVLIKKGGTDK